MSDSLTDPRRRPTLTPLLLPLLALVAAGAGAIWLSTRSQTTVVILVRHAEAATSSTGDADLGPAGERRAALLGGFLADALPGGQVDHLYSADTRRAQQTATSVANQFKLPINLLAGSDWARLPSRIRAEHGGETVVVVGYASTLPGVINELAGVQVRIADDDYGSIFIVVMPRPGPHRTLRLRYGPVATIGEVAADAR